MAFIVAEPCIKCKYTHCVATCPVECFHEGPNFLVINPDNCIDCNACVPECPADAIFSENDLPAHYQHYIELNARLAKEWPVITDSIEALSDADEWLNVNEKIKYLEY